MPRTPAGQVLDLDTSDVRVAGGADTRFDRLTIELWLRPGAIPSAGNRAGLVDKNGQFGFFLHGGGAARCTAGGAVASCGGVAIDTWSHLACTYDGSELIVYVDGAPCARDTGGSIRVADSPIHFGEDSPGGGDELVGQIDDVRLWTRARTAAELLRASE